MNRLSRLLLIPILLIFVGAAQAADYYQTVETDGLRITLDIWSTMGAPGYVPINLDITNLAAADRTIEITSKSQGSIRYSTSYYYGQPRTLTLDLHQSIRLKRGERQRLTIALPVAADNDNIQLQIRERSRVLHRVPFAYQTVALPELAPTLIVAIPSSAFGQTTRDLPRAATSVQSGLPPGMAEAYPPEMRPYTVSGKGPIDVTREPDRLPANWLGFTTFRAVFIGTQEWEALSAAQKDALLAWTASGGDLSFAGGDWQTLFPDPQRRPSAMGAGASQRYLLGQIFFPTLDDLKSKGLETTLSEMGNSVFATDPASGGDRFIKAPEYDTLRNRTKDISAQGNQDYSRWRLPVPGNFSYSSPPQVEQNGFRLPIPGVTGVSTRVYLAILVLFTLLIGPLNYWYLKRKRQQVLMVLTTPLISIVFIALLAGYAIAGEGFSIRARAETFTFLDQSSRQAATRATISMYAAGMAPGNGLRFPKDLALFPSTRESVDLGLDLTESQQFASGRMQARTPTNFDQIAFRTARERLTISRDDSGISVVNALGGSVQHLFYRDGGRVYALTAPVSPGERGALRPGELKDVEAMLQPDGKLPEPRPLHNGRERRFRRFFLDSLDDGAFFAVLDRSPFWEPGIPEIDERGSFHIIAGYAGGQP